MAITIDEFAVVYNTLALHKIILDLEAQLARYKFRLTADELPPVDDEYLVTDDGELTQVAYYWGEQGTWLLTEWGDPENSEESAVREITPKYWAYLPKL